MATYEQPGLATEIQRALDGVRRRIRAYVLAEGLAMLLLWLGCTFWLGLAVDYFPILVWASELPLAARVVGLLTISGGAVWILYHYVIRRVFARLTDRSMALILERRFENFDDGLVTTVEMKDKHRENIDLGMLANSADRAAATAADVSIAKVFRSGPLIWKWVACVAVLAPVGLFAQLAPDALRVWADRMYLLKDTPWPRNAAIDIVGVETIRPTTAWSEILPSKPVAFQNRRVKVAKGADLKLRVMADTNASITPDYCVVYYQIEDGGRGRVNMQKAGSPHGESQFYAFEGKPLRGVLSEVRMDVIGFDHRLRDYRIEIVDAPAVVETELVCRFPDYLSSDPTGTWSERTIDYRSSGIRLPKGTQVDIRCRTNKNIQQAFAVRLETGESLATEKIGDNRFRIPVVVDLDAVTLEVMLLDEDEIVTDQPLKISLQTIHDQPPQVEVRLQGIGSDVTADVVTPIAGKISDDFRIQSAWFNVKVADKGRQQPVKIGSGGVVDDRLDFRLLRSESGGMRLKPGDKLQLQVHASDFYQLDGSDPNQGENDSVTLNVVTPAELLAILERRELGLRRRHKQIIEETTQLRDAMLLIRSGYDPAKKDDAGTDPGDAGAARTKDELLERRRVRVRHGLSQSQKLAQEVLGVAVSFSDIRMELVNNRVDTEDRKQRIVDRIEQPLVAIAEKRFPELDSILVRLETQYNETGSSKIAEEAIEQANTILVELNQVLDAMVDIESFNELMELVRGLIEDQEKLIDQTDKKRKEDFFDAF